MAEKKALKTHYFYLYDLAWLLYKSVVLGAGDPVTCDTDLHSTNRAQLRKQKQII